MKSPVRKTLIYSNEKSISRELEGFVQAGFSLPNHDGGNYIECDEESMPFKNDAFDRCISFLALQWSNNINSIIVVGSSKICLGAFSEYYRILGKDHMIIGCLFGSGTLAELHRRLYFEQTNIGTFKDLFSPTAGSFK